MNLFEHRTDRQLLEELVNTVGTLDQDVQAATTLITALTAEVTSLQAQVATLTAGETVPEGDQSALEAAITAGNAVLAPPPPNPVPEALSVPDQNFSDSLGNVVSYQVTATGGVPSVLFAASGLPAGLTLDIDGLISGTPSASGTGTFVVTATDSTGATADGNVDYTIS